MNSGLNRRIRTVQYEDQRFSSMEIDLLHTPALQRLYDLHQLGLADRVFIDASHSRLHHVVGVVEQADKIMTAIIGNLNKHPDERLEYAGGPENGVTKRDLAVYADKRILAVRLMAMLHDLTHAPYGHTLEDEIELVDQKHDEPGRQANAFYRLVLQHLGWIERNSDPSAWGVDSRTQPKDDEYEALLAWYLDSPDLNEPPCSDGFIEFLAKRWSKFLKPRQLAERTLRKITFKALIHFLKDLSFAMRALLHLDLAHKEVEKVESQNVPEPEYPVDRLLRALLVEANSGLTEEDQFNPQRDVFLLDVIGNTICADLLDYARRDAANAGLRLDYDPQRIVDNMTVVSSAGPLPVSVPGKDGPVEFPFSDACLRTCISIFSHKLRTDVPGELLNLLQVRYFVYERMLYHPTKCVAGAILGAAIQFVGWKKLPAHWRFIGDQVFLHQVAETARFVRDLLASLPPTRRFDEALVRELCSKIQSLPTNGVALAATQLLQDRLISLADIEAHLNVIKRFQGQQSRSAILAPLISSECQGLLDENSLARIEKALKETHGLTNGAMEALGWLKEKLPTVGFIRNELKAALRLLDRLGARRYLKITFRLLPNARVRGLHGDAAKNAIADLFKRPLERKIAEREIERRSNLPPGSVVIHCPPVKGPKKIAKILISSTDKASGGTDQPRVAMLNSIKTIDPDVFTKHEEAIKALEEMYASTWRFAVSVAPPHDAAWKEVNKNVGDVLIELLTGSRGPQDTVKNDDYTVWEIEGIEGSIQEAEADEIAEIPVQSLEIIDPEKELIVRLGRELRKQEEFRLLPPNASNAEIAAASVHYQRRIWTLGKRAQPKTSTAPRSKHAVLEKFSEILGFDGLEKSSDVQMTEIINRVRHLSPEAWEEFSGQLSRFRSRTPISYNSVTQEQRKKLFEDIGAILTPIEAKAGENDSTSTE